MRLTHFFPKADRGQVLIAVALMVPVLLGMAAVAVDIGSYADDKRHLQNAADAIALAAAHDMCTPNLADCSDTTTATATANAYAAKNNINTNDMTVTFFTDSATEPHGAPEVRVTISRNHSFSFMKILGIGSKDVGVAAASVKVSPGGIPGAIPFGVTQATIDAAGSNPVTLKYDASGGSISGNFGAIDIDGTGNPPYQSGLEHGSASTMCSVAMPDCTQAACQSGGGFPNACSEDAEACDGPVCSSESGNKIAGTRTGIQFRLDNTSADCDTFGEVFPTVNGDGTYTINPNCNPWAGPGQCPAPADDTGQLCSRHVIVVPIIDGFSNGKSPVTVQGFALMYLDGFASGNNCTGNDCQVTGRFVTADISMNGLSCSTGVPSLCTFDPDSAIHFERLIE